ncbi:MAG: carbohydrate porin [Gammaproteobacteria bacterium]|nr:carbohydrate porin [Gammaproteobacteria bacterium]
MNKNYIALSLASIFSLGLISLNAQAELSLPSGTDTRPNLSLDPFERSREAMRKLPVTESAAEPVAQVKQQKTKEPIQEIREVARNPQTERAPASQESTDAFSYEFAVTMDAFSLIAGGVKQVDDPENIPKQTGVVGVIDFIAEVDTRAAGLWDNGSFFLYSALTFGQSPNAGDLHGISGIDAGRNTMKIMEMWYQHSFPYSHSSALFGLHDFNGEFYVSEYANLFVNGAFGGGQIIKSNGNPSTFPLINLGLRLKSELTENSYFQMGMYDGAQSEKEIDKIISISPSKKDGVFMIGEAGIFKNEPGDPAGYYKFAAGYWNLRADQVGFERVDANGDPLVGTNGDPIHILEEDPTPGTSGAYFLAETSIGEKMGLFFKHGRAAANYVQYEQFYAAGINYKGAIPGRDEDVLGIGFVHTRHSAAYLAQFDESNPDRPFIAETTYEITYTAQITDWLMIQPDYQYVQYPNMDPSLMKASVIGVRAQAIF